MDNLIRAAAFLGFTDLARELGANPLEILQQVNITPQQLQNPDGLLSAKAFVNALQIASEKTGHTDFGLRLGRRQDINMLGPIGLLARQCNTVKEAFAVIGRYVNLHNPGAIVEVQTYNNRTLLCYDDTTPGLPRNPQICDLALALGMDLLRFFKGKVWKPKAVFFVHREPDDTSFYQSTFNAPLFFDQEIYGVEFDVGILDAEVKQPDPELKQFFSRYVVQLEDQYQRDTLSVVEQLIRSLLSTGRCTEASIADILQINRRTLQRKLKAEGTSFKQLLAQIRADLATQYLLESNIPFTVVASVLGYSELSAFTRFFKTHFGITPTQFKQTNIKGK